jgi:hypothetical protein
MSTDKDIPLRAVGIAGRLVATCPSGQIEKNKRRGKNRMLSVNIIKANVECRKQRQKEEIKHPFSEHIFDRVENPMKNNDMKQSFSPSPFDTRCT